MLMKVLGARDPSVLSLDTDSAFPICKARAVRQQRKVKLRATDIPKENSIRDTIEANWRRQMRRFCLFGVDICIVR